MGRCLKFCCRMAVAKSHKVQSWIPKKIAKKNKKKTLLYGIRTAAEKMQKSVPTRQRTREFCAEFNSESGGSKNGYFYVGQGRGASSSSTWKRSSVLAISVPGRARIRERLGKGNPWQENCEFCAAAGIWLQLGLQPGKRLDHRIFLGFLI